MKQGSNNRRSRSRGGGKRHSGGGRNNFESNGPDVKIRGSAQQVQEKYLNLARDAISSGDWVGAEAFFQFAEHYYRIANFDANTGDGKAQGQSQSQGQGQGGHAANRPAAQDSPVPAARSAPEGEVKIIDTSPAALVAAVTERETEKAKAPKTVEAAAETEPEKAAS